MLIKKNNKILVGCFALLLVMAVGYALFSETITINGTATAKGEFKVSLSCEKGLNEKFGTVEDTFDVSEGGYKNDSCTVSGNTVSYHADLEYPGAIRLFTLKITNNGTMDAIYDTKNGHEFVKDYYCIDGGDDNRFSSANGIIEPEECTNMENVDSKEYMWLTHTTDKLGELMLLSYEKTDGTLVYAEDGVAEGFYNEDTYMVTLKSGESMYIVLSVVLNDIFPVG